MMKFQIQIISFLCASVLLTTSAFSASIPEREIQFRSIDFTTGVIELFNFGNVTEDLSGWRFCTHDEDETREYTASTGLNGVSIAAGESLFIHTNNDALASNEINISTIGGNFALPFDSGAFGMGLYYQTPFGVGANIADHIQWSIDGIDNTSADERSDEAETGGVWTDQSTWIATQANTLSIVLDDLTGADLHGPANYTVNNPDPADLNLDGFVDGLDLGILLGNWNTNTTPDQGELDGTQPIDGLDLGILLGSWNPPPASAAAVPEPTTLTLMGLALTALAFRRR